VILLRQGDAGQAGESEPDWL